jgi:hypothetical protein
MRKSRLIQVYFRIADGHLYRVHWKPGAATTLPTTKP